MPPKTKRILKSKNAEEQEEITQNKLKKMKINDENEMEVEEPAETRNWDEVMEKALSAKQIKTLVKSLATNADEAIKQLSVNELRHALYTASFIAIPEGQKFCARSLPKIGVKSAYYLIQRIAMDAKTSKQTCAHYGELIAVAWKYHNKENEEICKEIEEEMIKGLFHDSIIVKFPVSYNFIEMLTAFQGITCTNKAKMDNMLYQASRVSLWRNCVAVNNKVRYRASKIMLNFFPWRPTDQTELDVATNKQYSLFSSMLKDPCSEIRRESCCKIIKILSQYWIYIPSYTKRDLLGFICDDLVKDTDPAVRCAILEGLGFMAMEAVCQNATEVALKAVCPVTLIDKNDSVRFHTVRLLCKLIPNRFTKYWNIVSIETVMKMLDIETSESVKKEIVNLVFKSFYQKDEDYTETMKRLNYLAKFGRNASLTFYKLVVPEKLIEVQEAVAHLKKVGIALYKLVTGSTSNDSKILDDTVGSFTGPSGEAIDEKHPKFARAKLFMDCAVVLYATLLREPSFNTVGVEEQKDVKGGVAKLMTKIFQKMFQCYRETSALGTTMLLGSLLPQDQMTGLVRGVLRHIKEETDNEVVKPYLEAVTQWDSEAVISIIRDGLKILAKSGIKSPETKKARKLPQTPSEQFSKSLYYLSYLLSSTAAKDILIRTHLFDIDELYKLLCPIKRIINLRLQGANVEISDDLLIEAYVMKQTLICVLLNAPRKTERDGPDAAVYVRQMCEETEWFDEQVEKMADIIEDEDKKEFFFKLVNVFLRKLCDVLMSYDFSTMANAPSVSDVQFDMPESESFEKPDTNFIESFKRICFRFISRDTPSEFMPSIFNISRQLYLMNSTQSELAIKAALFTPTWLNAREHAGDELKDKHIGEQLYLLLKTIADCDHFQEYQYNFMKVLARALIDSLQWVIQDSGNCIDPRDHKYEIPRQTQILLFDSVKRHKGLFRILGGEFLELCASKDLLAKGNQDYNMHRSNDQVAIEILGACVQLAYLFEVDPEGIPNQKVSQKYNVLDNDVISKCVQELKRKMESLEERSKGRVDEVLMMEIKTMLGDE